MADFSSLYSENANNMKASTIRELLKLTQKPDIISFAGGLPAPDVFPVEDLRTSANIVFDTQGRKALQYGRPKAMMAFAMSWSSLNPGKASP